MSEILVYYDLVKIELGTEYVIKDAFTRSLHGFGPLIENRLKLGDSLLGRESFEGTPITSSKTYTVSDSKYTATAPSSYSTLEFKRIVSILLNKEKDTFRDNVIFLKDCPVPYVVSPLKLDLRGRVMWVYKIFFL